MVPRCTVCDEKIGAYGQSGTRCSRCNEPCPTCGKDVACCPHPLPALGTEPLSELKRTGTGGYWA